MIYAVLDGSKDAYSDPSVWGNSAIASIVAILMVFLILIIIIGITYLIFKFLGYFELKKQLDEFKSDKNEGSNQVSAPSVKFDENDQDMVAAVLVATIDYQNEIKQDVKLVSVKEIK